MEESAFEKRLRAILLIFYMKNHPLVERLRLCLDMIELMDVSVWCIAHVLRLRLVEHIRGMRIRLS